MAPSGLAQRYLAAIQNDWKDTQQASTSLLSTTDIPTKEDESDELTNAFNFNNIQSRNGSNSPSILRPRRDSSGSCPSRDSVSSEEESIAMMEELCQTQAQWRNFRNSMKQKAEEASLSERKLVSDQPVGVAATATLSSAAVSMTRSSHGCGMTRNGTQSTHSLRTQTPTVQQEEQETVSDVYPPTEIMNNISEQWKQKHLNQWKKTYVPSSSNRKSDKDDNNKWKQEVQKDHGCIRKGAKPTLNHEIDVERKNFRADIREENDSMDSKKVLPQHKLDVQLHDQMSTGRLTPPNSTNNPWAVKLRSVKSIKVRSDSNAVESKDLNPSPIATYDLDREKLLICNPVDLGEAKNKFMPVKQRLKDWNKKTQMGPSTETTESTSVAYNIQQDKTEWKHTTYLEAQSSKSSGCLSTISTSRSLYSPAKTFRKASSWIKSSLDTVEYLEPSNPVDSHVVDEQHPKDIPISIKKSTNSNGSSLERKISVVQQNSFKHDVKSKKLIQLENLESKKSTDSKRFASVSDTGVSATRVRNMRSFFESKLSEDRSTRNDVVGKMKTDTDMSQIGHVAEGLDGCIRKTNHVDEDRKIVAEVELVKAPKTLSLINSVKKSMSSREEQKHHVSSTRSQNSPSTQDFTQSRVTNGVSSLRAAFESSVNIATSKPSVPLRKQYPIDAHKTPQDEIDERESDFDAEIVSIGKIRCSSDDHIISSQSFSFQSLRNRFNGSGPNLIVPSNPSGGESTFNSLCVDNQSSFGDKAISSVSKIRPIPQKASHDIGKQSAFTAYQQRMNSHRVVNNSVEGNDIPWDDRTPNDIPWHDRELQEEKEKYMHEISILTDKRVIDMSYGIEYLDYSLDDDDGDGVTLSPHPSDVSSLSIPSCIQSLDTGTSDDDTGAIESINEKQSSVLGPSEASSSQMSESAKPLIYSALGTMGRKFSMKSSSDTSQSFSVQYTGLLSSLPSPSDHQTVESTMKDDEEKPFFMLQKLKKCQDLNDANSHFEDELDLHPGSEWKNDLFAINSVKSYTSCDDLRWPEFSDSAFDGCNVLSHAPGEKLVSSIGALSRKATPENSVSKSSRSAASPKPVHRKTMSSERIKSPTLPVVQECNLELAAIKSKPSSSDSNTPSDSLKDSTESRVSSYRRFNIQKVRAFQQFRRSGSYN